MWLLCKISYMPFYKLMNQSWNVFGLMISLHGPPWNVMVIIKGKFFTSFLAYVEWLILMQLNTKSFGSFLLTISNPNLHSTTQFKLVHCEIRLHVGQQFLTLECHLSTINDVWIVKLICTKWENKICFHFVAKLLTRNEAFIWTWTIVPHIQDGNIMNTLRIW